MREGVEGCGRNHADLNYGGYCERLGRGNQYAHSGYTGAVQLYIYVLEARRCHNMTLAQGTGHHVRVARTSQPNHKGLKEAKGDCLILSFNKTKNRPESLGC